MDFAFALFRAYAYLRAALRSRTITFGALPVLALGVLQLFEGVDWVAALPPRWQGFALSAYALVLMYLRVITNTPLVPPADPRA